MEHSQPTPARRRAQQTHLAREALCRHPKASVRTILLRESGFVEYCTDCNRVTWLVEDTQTIVRKKKIGGKH